MLSSLFLKVDKSRQPCVYYSHTVPLNQSLGYHWVPS